MSRLVIWFVALVTVICSSNIIESSPIAAKDLAKVLKLIQQLPQSNDRSKQRILRLRIGSSESEYSSDSESDDDSSGDDKSLGDDNNRIARQRSKASIVDLLEKVANEKNKNDRLRNRKGKRTNENSVKLYDADNTRLAKERIIDLIETAAANEKKKNILEKLSKGRNGYYIYRSENNENTLSSNDNVQKQILEKLLSQTSNVEERQTKPKKKRLIPNRLTGPTVTMDDVNKHYGIKNKNEELTGLENYSKVYIVLNPQAVKNSKNKNSLNDLISKVLSLSSQTPKREPQQVEPFRYKGFVVNQNLARRRFEKSKNKISRMGDEEKRLDQGAVPLERITAAPA